MLRAVFSTLRFIMLTLAGHKQIGLENVALRQQLAILKREQPRRSSIIEIVCFPHEGLETMKNAARYRTTRYGCELAAAAIRAVPVEAVAKEGTGTSAGGRRSPKVSSNNGGSQRPGTFAAAYWIAKDMTVGGSYFVRANGAMAGDRDARTRRGSDGVRRVGYSGGREHLILYSC